MAIKTEFKGTPMVPKGIKFPEFGMLTGDFGKEVLAEYQGRVKSEYGSPRALNVLSYSDGVVRGSNPFATVLVNSIIRANGLRTPTQADLEVALNAGVNLSGTYEDTALVLRSKSDPNSYLAGLVAKQLKTRGELKYPAVIPLNGFDLTRDDASPHGLAFKLRDDAEIIYAPVLRKGGSFTSEDIDLKTGLPRKVGENGNRTSYITNAGLSRLCLNGGLSLWSGNEGLAVSYADGRVCVVSGEATSQKMQDFIANLQAQRKNTEATLARIAKAEAVLRA